MLIVGAGGAGMYAAIAAARAGAERVLLADKSLVGRGGATIMAQMTVAAALGEECPDDWQAHLDDTLAAGRGLCDENLAAALCRDAPARIREMAEWRVGWARRENGRIAQVTAPGPFAAALLLCRFPEHRPGGRRDLAQADQPHRAASAASAI